MNSWFHLVYIRGALIRLLTAGAELPFMIFREAQIEDIERMQVVRRLVKENVLSNPGLVTNEDCKEYITRRGKGWVCEVESVVVGFAIADLTTNSIWALFVQPDQEEKGIGKKLHHLMLDWYFAQTKKTVWLTTAPATKAEFFYRRRGWEEQGYTAGGEIKFELSFKKWQLIKGLV
ncbi:MAG TPA: GNAT family N-acetyltransferase [Flavisolibacter sp.]|nr:GNAT family N-acetyltransferase [Flavisolibacter sp.]